MKPTFKQLLTKDDKLFLKHARNALGFDFQSVMADAQQAYERHSRASIAKREANLVILAALKEVGLEHWREEKDNKPAEKITVTPPVAEAGKTASGTKAREGRSMILDMADKGRA